MRQDLTLTALSMRLLQTTLVLPCFFFAGGFACGSDTEPANGSDTGVSEDGDIYQNVAVRTITLASGISVDVRGSESQLENLPDVPTGAELCLDYSLALTITFDGEATPRRFAATAISRDLIGKKREPPIPPPFGAMGDWLAPVFPGYDLQTHAALGGVSSNPIAVFPIRLSQSSDLLPQTLAVFHHDTGVPMAAFAYGTERETLAFPSTWHEIEAEGPLPGMEVSSRYIEGEAMLAQCDGHSDAIDAAMTVAAVEELAACGDIMAWPYSLPSPDLGTSNSTVCADPTHGFGVTLTAVLKHPWGTLECPRPADAQFSYVCFPRK